MNISSAVLDISEALDNNIINGSQLLSNISEYVDENNIDQINCKINPQDLTLLNFNIRSLSNNLDELKQLLLNINKVNIITLAETWLNSKYSINCNIV